MYADGRGLAQDNVYAHMWYSIAASGGKDSAVKSRDLIAQKMTAANIAKAQGLARACVARKYKGC
jgi:TPR repeat protein